MKITLSLLLLILLLAAAPLHFFVDEPDNFIGGKVIAQGGALYVDYWSHHTPLAYQLSAVFYKAGAREYVHFRLMYAVALWLFSIAITTLTRQTLALWVFLAIAATAPLTGANMLVAESMAGYLAIGAWLLIRARHPDNITVITLLIFMIPFAGLKQVYLAAFLFGVMCWQNRANPGLILKSLVVPAALCLIYLLVYQSGPELIEQAYQYNRDVYAPFFGQTTAPADSLASILNGLTRSLMVLRDTPAPVVLPLLFPVLLITAWLIRRRWFDALTIIGMLVLSFPPGYAAFGDGNHFTVFYIIMTGTAAYAVWWFCQGKSRPILKLTAVLLFGCTLIPGLQWQQFDRVDRPAPYAEMVNAIVRPGDTVWLAPATFHDWLLMDAPNAAAPYYFIYPWTWIDPVVRDDLMAKLQGNPPDVLVFERSGVVMNNPDWTMDNYAPELSAWVDTHYREIAPDIYRRH